MKRMKLKLERGSSRPPAELPTSRGDILFRWSALADVPELGIERDDILVYNPELPVPFTVTRTFRITPEAVVRCAARGALEQLPAMVLPDEARPPTLSLVPLSPRAPKARRARGSARGEGTAPA